MSLLYKDISELEEKLKLSVPKNMRYEGFSIKGKVSKMQPPIITQALQLVKLQKDIQALSEQLGNKIDLIYINAIKINIEACDDVKNVVDYFLENGEWSTWDQKHLPTRFYVLNYKGLKMTVGCLTKPKHTITDMWQQHEIRVSNVPMSFVDGTLLAYCLSIKPIEDDSYIVVNKELLTELSKVNKEC